METVAHSQVYIMFQLSPSLIPEPRVDLHIQVI